MRQDFLALLADARIPSDARVMAMLILEMGDGWHELSHEQFAALLDGPSSETIRRHLRKLENAGWIESKTNTGRRAPQYRFRPWDEAGPFQGVRNALLASLPESMPHTDEGETISAPQHGGVDDSFAPHRRGGEPVSPTPTRGRGAPTSSSLPPPPPPPPPSDRAIEFGEGRESMVGCRGSVADYLATGRVEGHDRQLAYVQSVAGIIEGTDEQLWMQPDGSRIHEGRAQIIAGCLNELRQGDEVGKWFPAPPGDIRNLHSKIRYKVKSIAGAKRDAERRPRAAASSGAEPPTSSKHPEVHIES